MAGRAGFVDQTISGKGRKVSVGGKKLRLGRLQKQNLVNLAVSMRLKGMTLEAISEALRVNLGTIYRWLKEKGVC